jgi:hypothetical protein
MLEGEDRVHPGAAADALDAESLAAQLFRGFEAGVGNDRVRELARDRGKDAQIKSLGSCAQDRRAAGIADLDVARNQARHQSWRAFDKNDTRFDALFAEQPLLLCDQERYGARAHGGDTDGDFRLSEGRRQSERCQKHGPGKKRQSARHISPLSAKTTAGLTVSISYIRKTWLRRQTFDQTERQSLAACVITELVSTSLRNRSLPTHLDISFPVLRLRA